MLILKFHFRFLRVDIDIYFFWVKLQIQEKCRNICRCQQPLKSLLNSTIKISTSEKPSIDKEKLLASGFLRAFWFCNKSIQFHPAQIFLHRNQQRLEFSPKNIYYSLGQISLSELKYLFIIMIKRKFYLLMRQSHTMKFIYNMPKFYIVLLQKFSSCRYIVEQVFHQKIRALSSLNRLLKF